MGRTQSFDEHTVLKKVQELFWRKGYNKTSLADLVEATGLHKGSLYRTFKSKDNLFLMALNDYAHVSQASFIKSNEKPLNYLKNFFTHMIENSLKNSKGCFVMNSCIELSSRKDSLSKASKKHFDNFKENFSTTVLMGQEQGEIDKSIKADKLATRLVGAAFAIVEISKFQKDRETFIAIANGVLREVGVKI